MNSGDLFRIFLDKISSLLKMSKGKNFLTLNTKNHRLNSEN